MDAKSKRTLFAPVTTPILLYDMAFGLVVMLLMGGKDEYLPLLRSKVPHALAICSLIIIEAVGRS